MALPSAAAAKTRGQLGRESHIVKQVSSQVGRRHPENTNARQYLIWWYDSTLAKKSAAMRPFRAGWAQCNRCSPIQVTSPGMGQCR